MIQTRDLMGIKFVNGGRSLSECDCWGIVMIAMKRFGKEIPDFDISCYDSNDINNARCFSESKFVKIKQPGSGVIIAINLDRAHPQYTQHFGVCLDNTKFIHILEKHGVLISKIRDGFFKNIVSGYYDWKT